MQVGHSGSPPRRARTPVRHPGQTSAAGTGHLPSAARRLAGPSAATSANRAGSCHVSCCSRCANRVCSAFLLSDRLPQPVRVIGVNRHGPPPGRISRTCALPGGPPAPAAGHPRMPAGEIPRDAGQFCGCLSVSACHDVSLRGLPRKPTNDSSHLANWLKPLTVRSQYNTELATGSSLLSQWTKPSRILSS
jgi:hypothetical protein